MGRSDLALRGLNDNAVSTQAPNGARRAVGTHHGPTRIHWPTTAYAIGGTATLAVIDSKKYTVVGYSNYDSTEPVYTVTALSDLFLGC